MVVAAGRTRKTQLKRALGIFQNVGVTASGLVLTMVPTKGPDAYGYVQYSVDAGYSYGSGPDTIDRVDAALLSKSSSLLSKMSR